ncbi:MAG: hypothetical protein ABEJ24_05145 [Candidatus Magasanikbacteria bacterium]
MNTSKVKNYWKEEQKLCQEIYENGFARYLQGLKQSKEVFQSDDRAIRCIDEGTPGGIHIAGSGILLSLEEAGRIISEIEEVDGIYSHAYCGAAALEAENTGYDGDSDDLGSRAAKEIAAEVNLPYLGEITAEQMQRPADLHTARAIYYDGIGGFDWSQVEGLPTGFIISRKYLYSDYAREEMDISIDIAFGDLGFGNRFDSDNPLLIVLLAENKEELEIMQQEAKDVTKKYNSDRIQIETYVQA